MSDSSLAQLYQSLETAWAEVPSTPTLTEVRYTSESLGQNTNTTVSAEVNADGQNSDIVRTSIEAAGDISTEISWGSHDPCFEGLLREQFQTLTSPTDDLTPSTGPDVYTRGAGSFISDGFEVGGRYYFAGATDPANNGWHKVTAVAALTLTVAETLVAEAAYSATVKGDVLWNGVDKISYLMEKKLPVTSGDEFISFRGCRVGSGTIDVAPGSITTGSFSFLGDRAYPAAATVGDGTPNAASTTSVLNAIDNIALVEEGGATLTDTLTSLNISINGALRGLPAIAVLGNSQIGIGTIEVTGTIEAYFENRTLYEKYTNFTDTSTGFEMSDTAGNRYFIWMDKMNSTSGEVVVPGKDGDVLATLGYTATKDSASGFSIGISRVAA
jgi:hypothetical protein